MNSNSSTPSNDLDWPDVELVDPPSDSVSALEFSPGLNVLAVASWDCQVRIYNVSPTGQTSSVTHYAHRAPVLCLAWHDKSTKLFSAGTDNICMMWEAKTRTVRPVAQHDAPIKCIKWVDLPSGGFLVTGSWDKTLKYWDLERSTPLATIQLGERCYAMDMIFPLLAVATAAKHIHLINLLQPREILTTIISTQKWQIRTIACVPDLSAIAVGDVGGRCSIQHILDEEKSGNYSWKCHRKDVKPKDGALVFALNEMRYHPVYETLMTCGSDGGLRVWDTEQRTGIHAFDTAPGPISAIAFNSTGTMMAYAISYDWSQGHSGAVPGRVEKVMLHRVTDNEAKKQPKR